MSTEHRREQTRPTGDPLNQLQVIDQLIVGPARLESNRLNVAYTVHQNGEVHSTELAYRWEEDVFDPSDPGCRNLASLIGAQLALNYGLFCREIVFHGPFDRADRTLLRRMAENTLLARVDDLTLGERITLARIGGPGVIARLVDSPEPRVLSSLLGNSKILERDAIKLACRSDAPESFLQKLAEHRWGQVREVRLGLIRNPRTPIPAALRLLGTLPASDLRRVAKDAKVRRLLRLSADRALPGAPPSRESP